MFSYLLKLFQVISSESESLKKTAKILKVHEIFQEGQGTLLIGQNSTEVELSKVMTEIVRMTMESSA